MFSTFACDILGNNQCSSGSKKYDECCEECASLDAEKISAIQSSTGSQNFKNTAISA